VREPQGNGGAERFMRTLKENVLWLGTFETVEELRLALLECKDSYNATWRIGRHGDQTPSQVRQEQRAALAKQAAWILVLKVSKKLLTDTVSDVLSGILGSLGYHIAPSGWFEKRYWVWVSFLSDYRSRECGEAAWARSWKDEIGWEKSACGSK
jgi:hypothetical protein